MGKTHRKVTWMNWLCFALGLSLVLLCGCVSRPVLQDCPKPIPAPAEFLQPLPEPGWFSRRLEEILAQTSDTSPTSLMNSSLSAEEPRDSYLADLF